MPSKERKSKYHTSSDYSKELDAKTVPTKTIEKTEDNLLEDFNKFVDSCRKVSKDKVSELKKTGRDDPVVHKRIVDKLLIGMFRGSKWSP